MGEEEKKPEEKTTLETPPVEKPAGGQAATKAKSNPTMIIVIVVIAVVVLGTGGYAVNRWVLHRAGEKTAEKIIENTTGTDVDVDSSDDGATIKSDQGEISTGSKASWPSTMPTDVPEFKYGTIAGAYSNTAGTIGWTVTYNSVDDDGLTKYVTEVKAAGWKQKSEFTASAVTAYIFEKGTYTLSISADSKDQGLTIGVVKNK